MELYSRRERQQAASALIGGWAVFRIIVIVAIVLLTGCTNMTVVKLAEMCHEAAKSPNASFNGSSGKVECK